MHMHANLKPTRVYAYSIQNTAYSRYYRVAAPGTPPLEGIVPRGISHLQLFSPAARRFGN